MAQTDTKPHGELWGNGPSLNSNVNRRQYNRSTQLRRPRLRARMATGVLRTLGRLAPSPPNGWAPTFLIGCGRSGTTILGQILNQRRDAWVANEPRHVWRAINLETDIWYVHHRQGVVRGRLAMTADDATDGATRIAGKLFFAVQRFHRCTLLVEKLPINSFRIDYLRGLFPRARFILILRHGLEVAHSIQRTGDRWYGPNGGHKWHLLSEYAVSKGFDSQFVSACKDDLSRGLVEWTLSVEAARDGLSRVAAGDIVTVRYENLLQTPRKTLDRVQQHFDWATDDQMATFAVKHLARQNRAADDLAMPPHVSHRTRELLAALDYEVGRRR